MPLLDWQRQMGEAFLKPGGFDKPFGKALAPVEKNRLAIYDELLFNTVLETMESVYPHCHRLIGEDGHNRDQWRRMVENYRRAYPNRDFKLMGAVCNFPEFLSTQPAWLEQYPFLVDLARYEWVEMAMLNAPDVSLPPETQFELPDVLALNQGRPVWNPVRALETLNYNIPAILEILKETPDAETLKNIPVQPIEVLVYREPDTADVRFFVLNIWTAKLLRQAEDASLSLEGILKNLHADPALKSLPFDTLVGQAYPLFRNFFEKQILLGSRPSL